MFFSVIVCIHNNVSIISKTLESIRSNDFNDYELIVVDDGSTDNPQELVKPLCNRFLRLEEKRGPAYARNYGVKHAAGEWLVFIDSDAIIPNKQLSLFRSTIFENPKCIGVSTGTSLECIDGGFYSKYCALQEEFYIREYVRKQKNHNFAFVTTRCGAINKKTFLKQKGFNESFKVPSIEDFEFSLKVLSSGTGHFYYLPDSEVKHYWVNSFSKLFKRLYRNAFLYTRWIDKDISKDIITTNSRALSNLASFMSLLFLPVVLVYFPVLYLSAILFIFSLWLQRDFILYLAPSGPLFQLRASLLLYILSVPVTAGALSGKIPGRRHHLWYH